MYNDTPKVSVIMSVYNAETFIRESIESILNQTLHDFEFIIVDDASIDNSKKIIQEYANKDCRIKFIINEHNCGRNFSRNKAIEAVTSKLIAIMDADDVSYINRLQLQYNFFSRKNVDVCFSAIEIYETNKIISHISADDDIPSTLLFENCICHSSAMFKTEKMKNVCGYSSEYSVAEDYDLWIKFISKKYKFGFIEQPLVKYRLNNDIPRLEYKYTMYILTKSIYQHQLSFIGIQGSDYELFIHFLCSVPCPVTSYEKKIARRWLDTIIIGNKQKFFYDQKGLEHRCTKIINSMQEIQFRSSPYRFSKRAIFSILKIIFYYIARIDIVRSIIFKAINFYKVYKY